MSFRSICRLSKPIKFVPSQLNHKGVFSKMTTSSIQHHRPVMPVQDNISAALYSYPEAGLSRSTNNYQQLAELLSNKQKFMRMLDALKATYKNESVEKNLLEMSFLERIQLICVFNTSDVMQMQNAILPVTYTYPDLQHTSCIHMFQNSASILTVITPRAAKIAEMETDVMKMVVADAKHAGAFLVHMHDFRKGTILFKCDPLRLSDVTASLQRKGYTLLTSNIYLAIKDPITLDTQEKAAYRHVLYRLLQMPHLEFVFDNLKYALSKDFGKKQTATE